MDFEQVAPRRAQRTDGVTVELIDRHHAQLYIGGALWFVDIAPASDQDWFGITVWADSLICSAGDASEDEREEALGLLVDGLRAMRVRVALDRAMRYAHDHH